MRKEHGEHNEAVCDYILSSGKYPDWVITTAFYSALHYVQHQVFPLTIGDEDYDTFEDYFAKHVKKKDHKISKHSATIELVRLHFYSALYPYQFLFDSCHSARYNDYNISPKLAESARKRLEQIKLMMTCYNAEP